MALPEAKLLYRKLDRLFAAIDGDRPKKKVGLETFLERFHGDLGDPLRVHAVRLYGERGAKFRLLKAIGPELPAPPEEIPAEHPALHLALQHGVYIFPSDGTEEPAPSGPPGAHYAGSSAILTLGERPGRFVIQFLLAEGWVHEELDFALNTVRAALGSRLIESRLRGALRQAAEIQMSLLPKEPPAFAGYDIACRSRPAEEVGGDFYDFASADGGGLALTIGDASGHGLPAALLVRDVVTGLRMGFERELRLSHVFWKLNRVIHMSQLSSLFVSVFYGEIEPNGHVAYINAGHQPPLLFRKKDVQELTVGGVVIGPMAEARYQQGFARVEPGSTLLLYTDGLVERRNPSGDFFGVERLQEIVRETEASPAAATLERIFKDVAAFGDGAPWEDDASAVVLKRLPAAG